MKTISKPKDNLGGLLKIWAVPNSVISVNKKTVTFSSTLNIYEIYCSPDSIFLKEQPAVTSAGTHYITQVLGFVPENSESNKSAISDMESRQFQVIIQDGNGNFLLVGNSFYPLKFSAELFQGKKTSDLAGYKIAFSALVISRAVFIDYPF